MAKQSSNVVQFVPRDIPREIALKVARLANDDRLARGEAGFDNLELAEVILVAIGAYREAVGR
jgi:hypothetical protein